MGTLWPCKKLFIFLRGIGHSTKRGDVAWCLGFVIKHFSEEMKIKRIDTT